MPELRCSTGNEFCKQMGLSFGETPVQFVDAIEAVPA